MNNVIAIGRTYIRLIEATQVVIGYTEAYAQRERLKQMVKD